MHIRAFAHTGELEPTCLLRKNSLPTGSKQILEKALLLSRNKKKWKLVNSFLAEVQPQISFYQQIFKLQGEKRSLQCCFLFSLDKQMNFWLVNRKGVRKCLLGSGPPGEPELLPTGAGCEGCIPADEVVSH